MNKTARFKKGIASKIAINILKNMKLLISQKITLSEYEYQQASCRKDGVTTYENGYRIAWNMLTDKDKTAFFKQLTIQSK